MVENDSHIEILIAAFLRGEAGPEKAMQVQDWVNYSAENKQHFLELEKLYTLTHKESSFDTSNIDGSWTKISKKTVKESVRTIHFNRNKFLLALAAILVLALLTTTFWLNKTGSSTISSGTKTMNNKEIEKLSRTLMAVSGVESFTLSDKSNIKLSKGSRLVLDKNFNRKDRVLQLEGSGEFQVVHDETKPFILSVNKLKIIDIGTLFRVESNPDTVKIVVDEGAVELRLNGQVILMNAGDSAFYVIQKDFISRYSKKKDRKNKVFEFDGTSLKEVASILSEFFERPIFIKDKEIESCTLTVRFKNENLMTILDVIKELMDIEVVNNNQVIELYGKGCN